MVRGRSLRRAVGELTNAGLVARNCGTRMHRAGWDWVTLVAYTDFNLRPWLDEDETAAYNSLLPATWWAQWFRGWNDQAERDAAPAPRGEDGQ